jgi:hypothetical protein
MLNKKTTKQKEPGNTQSGIVEVFIDNFKNEVDKISLLLDRFKFIAMVKFK